MPAALGFLVIGGLGVLKKVREVQADQHLPLLAVADGKCPPGSYLRLAPLAFVSRCGGSLARTEVPFAWMRTLALGWYVREYGVDLAEAAITAPASYPSLAALFTRELRDGVRRIEAAPGAVVSPVDGTLVHHGSVQLSGAGGEVGADELVIEQVKGMAYPLVDLLGEMPDGLAAVAAAETACSEGRRLHYAVLYLAPGNYHRVHAPADLELTQRRHFQGGRLPLRPKYLQAFPSLFCDNERVVLNGSWQNGFFALVAVGALNVGSITLAFDDEMRDRELLRKAQASWWSRVTGRAKVAERMYASLDTD